MLQQFYPVHTHDYPFELNKDFQFAAAHYLPSKKAGKCQNTHGHTYFVNVTIVGEELDDAGMLVDFATLKAIIHDRFDHKVMNDDIHMPSTEAVARFMYDVIKETLRAYPNSPKVHQVLVRETPTSYVIYRGGAHA